MTARAMLPFKVRQMFPGELFATDNGITVPVTQCHPECRGTWTWFSPKFSYRGEYLRFRG